MRLNLPPPAPTLAGILTAVGGDSLAVCCDGGVVGIVQASGSASAEKVQRLSCDDSGALEVDAATCSADGLVLAVAYRRWLVAYDVARLAEVGRYRLSSHPKSVDAAALPRADEGAQRAARYLLAVAGANGVELYLHGAGDDAAVPADGTEARGAPWRVLHRGYPIAGVRIAPDGSSLAAASYDGNLGVWSTGARGEDGLPRLAAASELWFEGGGPGADRATSLEFSPSGRALALALWSGAVLVYSRQADVPAPPARPARLPPSRRGLLQGAPAAVSAAVPGTFVAWSPNGLLLAVAFGSQGGAVGLYCAAEGTPLLSLPPPAPAAPCAASPPSPPPSPPTTAPASSVSSPGPAPPPGAPARSGCSSTGPTAASAVPRARASPVRPRPARPARPAPPRAPRPREADPGGAGAALLSAALPLALALRRPAEGAASGRRSRCRSRSCRAPCSRRAGRTRRAAGGAGGARGSPPPPSAPAAPWPSPRGTRSSPPSPGRRMRGWSWRGRRWRPRRLARLPPPDALHATLSDGSRCAFRPAAAPAPALVPLPLPASPQADAEAECRAALAALALEPPLGAPGPAHPPETPA
eukprot:tig00020614_g12129.t1